MANFRTQIGLGQITASFGNPGNGDLKGAILDNLSAATSGSIVSNNLSGSLSHIASAIKRIHGHDSFSEGLAGVFNNTDSVFSGSITVKNSSDATKFTVDTNGDATVGRDLSVTRDVTITGDLTVNGQTTTVNTANTVLKDRILALASGSAVADADSGIVFTRSTADLGGASNQTHGAMLFDGAAGNIFKFGATNADASTNVLTVADADLGDVYVGKLLVDGSSNHLDITATNFVATAAADFTIDAVSEINLDADGDNIRFLAGGDGEVGKIKMDAGGNGLILSASGESLVLDSATGLIVLGKDFDNSGGPKGGIGLSLGVESVDFVKTNEEAPGENVVKIVHSDTYGNGKLIVSGTFEIKDDDAGNAVGLKVASSTAAYSLTFPSANGTAGQILKVNSVVGSNANLAFANQAADHSRFAYSATQLIDALSTISFGESKTTGISALSGSSTGDNLSITIADDAKNKGVEVFVNGMLLVSGSNTEATNGTVDYTIVNNSSVKFAFDLENQDVVQIIQR